MSRRVNARFGEIGGAEQRTVTFQECHISGFQQHISNDSLELQDGEIPMRQSVTRGRFSSVYTGKWSNLSSSTGVEWRRGTIGSA